MSSRFLEIDDHLIVRRSARARQLSLRLDNRTGAAILTLPRGVSVREAALFATEHKGWLARQRAALPPAIRLAPGEEVPILGRLHLIVHDAGIGRRPLIEAEPAAIRVGGETSEVANRIRRYLKARAGEELAQRVARHAATLDVTYNRLRLTDPMGRWGSCSATGALSFSWRLIMAPEWIIDYVVAHEVAHLKEMNHSRRFWAHVRQLVGDPAPARAWLGRQGTALQRVG